MIYYVCKIVTRGTAGTFTKSKFTKDISACNISCCRKIGHACIYLAGSDFKLYSDQFFRFTVRILCKI